MHVRSVLVLVALLLSACETAGSGADAGAVDAGPPPMPWAVGFPSPVEAVAVDGAGRVYAATWDGTLRAFDAAGAPLFQADGPCCDFAARHRLAGLDDGVVAGVDGSVVRYGPNGGERWRVALGALAVAVGEDTVAALTIDALVTLDLDDGVERWRAGLVEIGGRPTARESIVAALPDGGWAVTPPLAVYSASGELRWDAPVPPREIHALAVDGDGTMLVTGVYGIFGVDFGLGPLPEAVNFDPFVALFDPDGSPRAAIAFSGPDFEYPYAAASDGARFLVAGHYGEFSNGITIGDHHLEAVGGRDAFLAWLDADGRVEEARSISGPGTVIARAAAWSPRGRWVVAGILSGATVELAGTTIGPVEPWSGFLWVGPE